MEWGRRILHDIEEFPRALYVLLRIPVSADPCLNVDSFHSGAEITVIPQIEEDVHQRNLNEI